MPVATAGVVTFALAISTAHCCVRCGRRFVPVIDTFLHTAVITRAYCITCGKIINQVTVNDTPQWHPALFSISYHKRRKYSLVVGDIFSARLPSGYQA